MPRGAHLIVAPLFAQRAPAAPCATLQCIHADALADPCVETAGPILSDHEDTRGATW